MESNSVVDCDSLPGKLRDICSGTAVKADGKPFSLIDRRKIIGARLRIHWTEVELPNAPADEMNRTYSGIGDKLHKIIARETGQAIPCSSCKEDIERLNWRSVEQVQRDRNSLASRIASRAKNAPKWWQRWGAKLAPGRVLKLVLTWIDEACGIEPQPEDDDQPEPEPDRLDDSEPPISRIVVAVRTANRDEPTLSATLASIEAAGFERPIVFGEPDAPDEVDVRWAEHKGAFRGFVEHIRWLLANTEAEWFLLCEDDVEFSTGLADRLRQHKLGRAEILTLFKPHGLKLIGEGLVRVRDVNGSLAVLAHRREMTAILTSRAVRRWPKQDCVDKLLTRAAAEIRAQILSPTKSWVQHVGRTSVCQPKRWRTNSLTHRMRFASDFDGSAKSNQPGLVTLITPTGDRAEAFALCERWMSQQRYTGEIQWIVVDDGRQPTQCTMGQEYIRRARGREWHSLTANMREAIPLIRGKHILVIEDDDYYGPDYLSVMVGQLQHADLVGEFGAKYYYLRHQKWRHRSNETWASLCRTGFNHAALEMFIECCRTNHPSIDGRLWERWTGSRASWVDKRGDFRGCVGIKGVAGRQSRGWRPSKDSVFDSNWQKLKLWVGDDWEVYKELSLTLPKRFRSTTAAQKSVVSKIKN